MPDVIVTDGLWRKSLSAVRSLGKSGYNVTVFGDSLFTTSFWSRYTNKRIVCPDAKEHPDEFGKKLTSYLVHKKNKIKPVLLPMEDDTLNWVSENRKSLSDFSDFLIPSKESLAVAQDKSATLKLASKLGLTTPKTYCPSSLDEFTTQLDELKKQDNIKNYIIKPVTGSGSSGLIYLEEDSSINWEHHWSEHGRLVIQERISHQGQGIGVSLLFDTKSHCVASFVHARLQQYPNSGGPSTSRVSIENNALIEKSILLLKGLNWQGVAMVEWKMDPQSNTPKLMEINPRFWGSLELAIRAGIDFPSLYVMAAQKKDINNYHQYTTGVICRWLFPGEILRYISQNKTDREGILSFLKGLPSTAEEWNSQDIRGFFSAFFCPAFSILNPKYWKYIR